MSFTVKTHTQNTHKKKPHKKYPICSSFPYIFWLENS